MAPPAFFSKQAFERLIRTRWFNVLTVGVVCACLLLAGRQINFLEALDNLENSLLDSRLRLRASTFAPSEDILIIAKDQNTDSYALDHPELNLYGTALPRSRVAQIVDYAAGQGARAIVLDVEFKSPTTPANDASLERAIERAQNVYLAIAFDGNVQQVGDSNQVYLQMFSAVLTDVFRQAYWRDKVLWGKPSKDAGLHYLPLELLFQVSALEGERQKHTSHSLMGFVNPSLPYRLSGLTPRLFDPRTLQQQIEYACFFGRYQHQFASHGEFLTLLEEKAVPVRRGNPKNPDASLTLPPYCGSKFILPSYVEAAQGIGVVAVDYNKDAYIRDVPVLYQGYKGNYYAYLGVRPVLDLLNIPYLTYVPSEGIGFGGQTVPFYQNNKVLINWRNPHLLASRIKARYQLNRVLQQYEKELQSIQQACPAPQHYLRQEQARLLQGHSRRSVNHLQLLSLLSLHSGGPGAGIWDSIQWADEQQHGVDQWVAQIQSAAATAETYRYLAGGKMYRRVSAIDVILQAEGLPPRAGSTLYNVVGNPESGLLSLKNKVLIYGDVIKDIHRSPVDNEMVGPDIVATVLDMFWHDNQFIQKISDWRIYSVVVLLALGVLGALISPRVRLLYGILISMMVVAIYWVFNFAIFSQLGYFFPLAVPTLVLITVIVLTTMYRYWIQDTEKRQLTHVFSNYVSPQVMDEILKSPDRAMENLKGRKQELTVLFADIKNFTRVFENAEPETMVDQLREYFDAMNTIILKYDGTIDKYMGDAMMAFFGAPVPHGNHAEIACRAALEMQAELSRLNERWRAEGKVPLEHGVGISTGEMVVGHFGSSKLQNYTVMGNRVNLGARLETYTREVDAPVIISEATYQSVQQLFTVRDLGKIQVKGFSDPLQVYALEEERNG